MTMPYVPTGKLTARFNRQWARLTARSPLHIDLDHAIVTFTFDDFPKSAAATGAKALEARDWRGTYYASASYAGGTTHHGAMFDAGDLQRLVTAGHEIGCHTYDHLDCAAADLETVQQSVARNARALASMGLETALESFAFPYGETTAACKHELGPQFSALRGVRARVNRDICDRHLLASVPIDGGEAGIQRAVEAATSLTQSPGWLIFYAHDIQDEPTEWGCTPEQFERVCEAVAASGARVQTMTEALKTLEQGA
jgi:peptidoglycan/xylan/chitin deacetylase (PgdA/CDA1 family)